MIRKLAFVALDTLLISGSYLGAFILRLGWPVTREHLPVILQTLPIILIISLPIHLKLGLFNAVLRYASINTLVAVFKAVGLSLAVSCLILFTLFRMDGVPRGTFAIYGMILLLSVGGTRMAFRLGRHGRGDSFLQDAPKVLIYGADDNAEILMRSLMATRPSPYQLVGLIDDDPSKRNHDIHGLAILGSAEDLVSIVPKLGVTELWITPPELSGEELRRIYDFARAAHVRVKILPRVARAFDGVRMESFQDLEISHLLRRPLRKLGRHLTRSWLRARKVLITGAGGSIGRELSRQIVEWGPSSVALCDASEENLFRIHTDLKPRHESVLKRPFLVDVRNATAVECMFQQATPDVVIHAAAFKHVHIVELNPCEGVLTNVAGLMEVARAAERHGVKEFLFISTDKSIQPTSVMGATKRLGEMFIRCMNRIGKTRYMAVRFGNVLGSSGSVLPIFQEQIRKGQAITVTHPEMTRYFMLIAEAVELILQAGSINGRGDIYILDMGKPVKIVDLAVDLASLMGKEVGKDIQIEFVGIRPGEKIHEECPIGPDDEQTLYSDIWIAKSSEDQVRSMDVFFAGLEQLVGAAKRGAAHEVIDHLKRLVPEFSPSAEYAAVVESRQAPTPVE